MAEQEPMGQDQRSIDEAVAHFEKNRLLFQNFAESLVELFRNDSVLAPCIQFMTYRIKNPEHLREKILRKVREASKRNERMVVDASNVFDLVSDLAGLRILHLHTAEVSRIHPRILAILSEQRMRIVEPPTAYCWDVEYETLFGGFGIGTASTESMYTTVHYVVQANEKIKVRCEIQLRTLMDEVWGQVSHRVNYPTESPSVACQDQLKVLARLTSGCARLVDSIVRSHSDAIKQTNT